MSYLRRRIQPDERGASLILAIAFMLVAGMIAASLLNTTIASSTDHRVTLNNVRNRQYDADAAIETSVARVRGVNPITGSYTGACPTTPDSFTGPNTGLPFRVNCSYSPTIAPNPNASGDPVSPNNVTFYVCQGTVACTPINATITARVNFQSVNGQTVTFVQSWSVNK